MDSQSGVIMFLSILLSLAVTTSCATLLYGFYSSQKRKRFTMAIGTLVFSNGLNAAVGLPIWIYMNYGMDHMSRKLLNAHNAIDITLTVATTLQLLLISYKQLRVKAQPTFNCTDKTTKYLLLLTWILGLAAAVTQALIRNSPIVLTILTAFVLIPFLCMVILFFCMLFTKKNPNGSPDQQYGATTKSGLIVCSCLVCLIPSILVMMLMHLKIIKVSYFVAEVVIFLRYLNGLFTTIIHGYKSVELKQEFANIGKEGEIVQVCLNPKNLPVNSTKAADLLKV